MRGGEIITDIEKEATIACVCLMASNLSLDLCAEWCLHVNRCKTLGMKNEGIMSALDVKRLPSS